MSDAADIIGNTVGLIDTYVRRKFHETISV
jgi:hypothetical protein